MAIYWERAVPLAFHLWSFYFSAVLIVGVPFPFVFGAGCGIWLYWFLVFAFLLTLYLGKASADEKGIWQSLGLDRVNVNICAILYQTISYCSREQMDKFSQTDLSRTVKQLNKLTGDGHRKWSLNLVDNYKNWKKAIVLILTYDTRFDKMSPPVTFR